MSIARRFILSQLLIALIFSVLTGFASADARATTPISGNYFSQNQKSEERIESIVFYSEADIEFTYHYDGRKTYDVDKVPSQSKGERYQSEIIVQKSGAARPPPDLGGFLAPRTGGLKAKWADVAGEWRGWRQGFADNGRFRWTGSDGMRSRLAERMGAQPLDALHHRIFAQGGTRGGAGNLTLRGFFKEQYGRYIPNFIKNTKWNIRNMTTSTSRGIRAS